MTDLSQLVPMDTFPVEIKHPVTGEAMLTSAGEPQTITVYGPYSEKFKEVAHAQAKARMSKIAKSKGKNEMSVADMNEYSLQVLAATTYDWNLEWSGAPLEYSEAKAKEIYAKLPWLIDQVRVAQDDVTNFFGK